LLKILCLKQRRLGDTVLWTAALRAVRDHFPEAEIDLAYPRAYEALFVDDNRYRQAPSDLRSRKYDLALNFHASSRTGRQTLWSGAKQRVIHFHSRRAKSAFFSLPIPNLGQPMSAVERDLNVVRAVGWKSESPAPELVVGQARREVGEKLLRERGWAGGPLVLLSVAASRPSKQWALARYAELTKLLKKRVQVGIVYDGKKPDSPELFQNALDLPTPDLSLLLGTLPFASQWIGSDSGVKHVACALGIPTLTLFGPESIGEWHAYPNPIHQTIQRPVGCRTQDPEPKEFAWCGVEICPLGSHACMNLIRVEDVLASLPTSLVG